MKTNWDYSELAQAYLKRPKYSEDAIDHICTITEVTAGSWVCDIGAGTGILTRMLLERALRVVAVEPNDSMRNLGRDSTLGQPVQWLEGAAEATGLPDATYPLVTFGSSFNTTDRELALLETCRILKTDGWMGCLWNHRNLDDPLQSEVESIIRSHVHDYSYGTRRQDQTEVLTASRLFCDIQSGEFPHVAVIAPEDYMEAWRSHATLQRQSGASFGWILAEIEKLVYGSPKITVPYVTRLWLARRSDARS